MWDPESRRRGQATQLRPTIATISDAPGSQSRQLTSGFTSAYAEILGERSRQLEEYETNSRELAAARQLAVSSSSSWSSYDQDLIRGGGAQDVLSQAVEFSTVDVTRPHLQTAPQSNQVVMHAALINFYDRGCWPCCNILASHAFARCTGTHPDRARELTQRHCGFIAFLLNLIVVVLFIVVYTDPFAPVARETMVVLANHSLVDIETMMPPLAPAPPHPVAPPAPYPPEPPPPAPIDQSWTIPYLETVGDIGPKYGDVYWKKLVRHRMEHVAHACRHHRAEVLFMGDENFEKWDGTVRGVGVAEAQRIKDGFHNHNPLPQPSVSSAIAGDTAEMLLWRLGSMEKGISFKRLKCQPLVIVLYIGTADLEVGHSPDQVAKAVLLVVKSLERLYPASNILILGLLPNAEDVHKGRQVSKTGHMVKDAAGASQNLMQVESVNKWFQVIADRAPHTEFLDCGLYFLQTAKGGKLQLHNSLLSGWKDLTLEGYYKWFGECVNPVVWRLIKTQIKKGSIQSKTQQYNHRMMPFYSYGQHKPKLENPFTRPKWRKVRPDKKRG